MALSNQDFSTIFPLTSISRPTKQGSLKDSPLTKLSRRERQCLYYCTRGMSANAIALELGLSKRTIEDYLERAKNKLGCANKFELIDYIISSFFSDYHNIYHFCFNDFNIIDSSDSA